MIAEVDVVRDTGVYRHNTRSLDKTSGKIVSSINGCAYSVLGCKELFGPY